jgi:signal transduction histidine kinase
MWEPRAGKERDLGSTAAMPLVASPDVARAPPRLSVVWGIAFAGCAAAGSTFALALASETVSEPAVRALTVDWVVLTYVLAGLIAWWRRPESRFGALMVAAGFAAFLSHLSWTSLALPYGTAVPYTVGLACALLPPVLFLHVFLAFPSGRLERPFDRALVAAAYLTAIGLDLVVMSLGSRGRHNLVELVAEPGAGEVVRRVQLVGLSVFSLVGIAVLVRRRRGAGRPSRPSLALLIDSFALCLIAIPVLLVSSIVDPPHQEQILRVTYAVVGAAPLVFLTVLLRARLARSAVGDLFVELRADPEPADLRDALARALRDPTLTLAYWLDDFRTYVDQDGRPAELPGDVDGRVRLIESDGRRIGALVHDAALSDEPELLDAVAAAAGIALENARLNVELRARLEELRGSRARVIDAAQKERQRLERNLHDGAQQRLVALSLELDLLEQELAPDRAGRIRFDAAREQVAVSLEELRELAGGIHPAVVTAHGLAVALEELAARAPVPVRLTVQVEGRLPESLEVAAYYVVSESLANIGKHARASSGTIVVTRASRHVVRIEIVDDGIGGADTEDGSGLRGLGDRVEALGGRLMVWSPRGGGTRVRAELPCAS